MIEELAKRLLFLRASGIALIALLLSFSAALTLALPYDKLLILCLAWVVLHGFSVFSQRRWQISATSMSLQLSADMIVVTSLLAVSGGVHNPFFGLLLLPLLLTVGILPRWHQYGLLALLLLASTLLIFVPAPLNAIMPNIPNRIYEILFLIDGGLVRSTPFNPLDVLAKIGLWLNLGLTAILVTFFLAKLHQRLQHQQQTLQQMQLEGQSQQHLLTMSLAAASTAHELSTPLASISLLAAEAADAYHYQEPDNAQAALTQIQQLVRDCKTQISASLKQHHLERSEQLSLLSWSAYLEQLVTQWKTLRPQVKVLLTINNNREKMPQVINLPLLSQSITSLFNNASEASNEPLHLALSWDDLQVSLCLHNQGQGFSQALLAQFPQPQLSDKLEGHGIGLALANANLQQLGGQLKLSNPPEGGAKACITLPKLVENWSVRHNAAQSHSTLMP